MSKNYTIKKALEMRDVEGQGFIPAASHGYERVVGKTKLLEALTLGQEKALDFLSAAEKEKLKPVIKDLKKDPRLKNTLVRLNYADPVDDLKRVIQNRDNIPLPLAIPLFTTLLKPLTHLGGKPNYYDPFTDTVTVSTNIPEILHHELGHARDFNDPNRSRKARIYGMLLQNLANTMEHIPLAGKTIASTIPVNQYLETRANNEALSGLKTPEDRKKFRRRAWPARSTYILGGLLGLTSYAKPELLKGIFDKRNELVDKLLPNSSGPTKAITSALLTAAGVLGTAGIAGRTAAEIRNLFDN
jgi:hypothetical protein